MGTSVSFCLNNGDHVTDLELSRSLGPHRCVADMVGKGDFSETYNTALKAAGRSVNKITQNGLPSLTENMRQLYTGEQKERHISIKTIGNSLSSIGHSFLSSEKSV